MIATLLKQYVLVCLLAVFAGVALDYYSSSCAPETVTLSTIVDGKVENNNYLSFPAHFYLMRIGSSLFYTIAISVFISVFITTRMEAAQRIAAEAQLKEIHKTREAELQALRQAINVDVFDSLFRTVMPHEIFEAVKEDIIRAKFLRRNANWIFDFSVDGDQITQVATITHELHNLGHEPRSESVNMRFFSEGDAPYTIEKAFCDGEGRTLVSYDRVDATKNRGVDIESDGRTTNVRFAVDVPPRKFVTMTTVTTQTYRLSVHDELLVQGPLIDATLTVNYPISHRFELFSQFSGDFKNVLELPTRQIWKLGGAALPKQGFVFVLTRKA